MTFKHAFQQRVDDVAVPIFGQAALSDKDERNHRFLEEALELVQSADCTAEEAHRIVDFVFARKKGKTFQEAGCVMVGLAALCTAHDIDMAQAGEVELKRIQDNYDEIRDHQAMKPRFETSKP